MPSRESAERSSDAQAVWMPLDAALSDLRLTISGPHPGEMDASQRRHWEALCACNPKLFDGSILSFDRLEGDTIHASTSSYAKLITRVPGVVHLSVTGVLEDDRRRVLLGRRSGSTGVHPGVWEFVPSGGLDVPEPRALSARSFSDQITRQLERELLEELGPGAAVGPPALLGLVIDPGVPSTDVVLRCRLHGTSPLEPGWEHDELRWVAQDAVEELTAGNGCIPTVPAIAQALLEP